jgi:uncharacterized 2Fe-2S/4Fe-4S cluster protein (DUF4445 family)
MQNAMGKYDSYDSLIINCICEKLSSIERDIIYKYAATYLRRALSSSIHIQPVGKRISATDGETILSCLQRAGVILNATCGGTGSCGQCLIQIISGEVSTPTPFETGEIELNRIKAGWRFACQTSVKGDLKVFIPAASMATAQRTQTEGKDTQIEIDPAVSAHTITVAKPNPDDPEAVIENLQKALPEVRLTISPDVLAALPRDMQDCKNRGDAWLRGSSLVAFRPAGSPMLGVAVDLGTTKLAVYLVNLRTGETIASSGAMNPQIAYGEDVIARISYAMQQPDGAKQLRQAVAQKLNEMIHDLCHNAGLSTRAVADAVVVGNTAMHHLFTGLPVNQLGLAPYEPAVYDAMDIDAHAAGFGVAPGATVHLLPNIAGFVGADHVAMLLGSGILESAGIVLGMDIGTNTEVSLIANGRHYACSTASGPAFEGAHIRQGMRAAPGAIEKVLINNGQVQIQTIGGQPPTGLCGSGILDLVAQLFTNGIITRGGSFNPNCKDARIRQGEHGKEYVVIKAEENTGNEIAFSRRDINEIQLVKGAMRAGVSILLREAGISEKDIDRVFLAGAFGTYLDVQSGIDIGMFPHIPKDRFIQVGNAAGTGARMALLSKRKRAQAVEVAHKVNYVELTTMKDFVTIFSEAMFLGKS